MAKRGSDRREARFDPEELDMRREREYLYRHPAPRDMDDYFEHVMTVRSEEEVEHRKRMIEEIRGSNTIQEQMHFEKMEINYNTHSLGRIFSNILMSYLLDHRVKVRDIDFTAYQQRAVLNFSVSLKTKEGTDVLADEVEDDQATLREYTKQWLNQSRFKDYIEAWRLKSGGNSIVHSSMPHEDTDSVRINPGVLVTRRCALISLHHYCKNRICGHENFMFWQIREETGVVMIEYGICDNLKIDEIYQPMKGINWNFHDVIEEAFREYLRDCPVDNMKVSFVFIENLLPCTNVDQLHYNSFSYVCMAVARRGLLYFAIFYDIYRLDLNEDMEHFVSHEDLRDGGELTRKQMLYVKNYTAYTHYMNKMIEWVLSSPLLWPVYDPLLAEELQVRPTRERPLCIVLFPDGYDYEVPFNVYEEHHGNLNHLNVWTDMNGESCMGVTYISLYNFFDERITRYYFHMDGGEVFRPEMSEYEGSTCAVSAAADFSELSCVMSALHQRLKVLELTRL